MEDLRAGSGQRLLAALACGLAGGCIGTMLYATLPGDSYRHDWFAPFVPLVSVWIAFVIAHALLRARAKRAWFADRGLIYPRRR